MKKAPAPEEAKRHSQSQSQYSAYGDRKGISGDALSAMGCEVRRIELARFDADGKLIEPWTGNAIFAPLYDLLTAEPAGFERILDEAIQRNPDDKAKDKLVT